MTDERALEAMARIEQALARMEAAADRSLAVHAELSGLREKHQALRDRIEGAVAEIDRMLEAEEG